MQALGSRKAIGILLVVVAFGLIANLVAFWIVPAVVAATQQTFRNTQVPSPIGNMTPTDESIVPLSMGETGGIMGGGKNPWAIYGVVASGTPTDSATGGPDFDQADGNNTIAVGYVEFGPGGQVWNYISRTAWEATPPQIP